MCHGTEVELRTDYNGIGKVLYILGQQGITAYESDYGADVALKILARKTKIKPATHAPENS